MRITLNTLAKAVRVSSVLGTAFYRKKFHKTVGSMDWYPAKSGASDILPVIIKRQLLIKTQVSLSIPDMLLVMMNIQLSI